MSADFPHHGWEFAPYTGLLAAVAFMCLVEYRVIYETREIDKGGT